jgi:hypothetical protein
MRRLALLCCILFAAACGNGISRDPSTSATADAIALLGQTGVRCEGGPNPSAPPFAACANKKAGDACTFTDDDESATVNGTCTPKRNRPDVLMCKGPDEDEDEDRAPPPVAACTGKKAADACSFTARAFTISGNCGAIPGTSALVCLPTPPQELIDACAHKALDDSCTVVLGGISWTATCQTAPDGTTLACLPTFSAFPPHPDGSERMPATMPTCSRASGGPLCAAIAACASKATDADCSFQWKDDAISGVCRTMPDGSTPVCAPLCLPQ